MRPRVLLSESIGSVPCLVVALVLTIGSPAFAQFQNTGEVDQQGEIPRVDEYPQQPVSVDSPPPSVSDIEGSARLVRRGEEESLSVGNLLTAGDSIVTDRGRVELVWGNGSVVSVDEDSRVDLLSDDLIRLVGGRVRIELAPQDRAEQADDIVPFRVDTPDASVQLRDAGDYRVDATWSDQAGAAGETMVAVLRGEADVVRSGDQATLIAGERVVVRAEELLAPVTFNVARFDAFDTWVDARQRNRQTSTSAGYLPSELQPYGQSFDMHGTWRRDPTYGSVWYPRTDYGWRPYFDGGWRYYPTYGWTWISGSPWGSVTHHYGRWGVGAGGAWFWIPARRWAGAWVSWAWTRSYVGWCPLGWNGRPLYAFGSWRSRYGRGYRRGYRDGYVDGRHTWSVIRWDHFGHRRLDRRYAVQVTDVDWSRSRVGAGRALPRAVTRSYASHSVAVPRGSATSVRRGALSVRERSRASVSRDSHVGAPRNSERARALDARQSSVVDTRRAQPRTARTVSPGTPFSELRGARSSDRQRVTSEQPSLRRAVPRAAPSVRSASPSRAPSSARMASPSRAPSRARMASPSRAPSSARMASPSRAPSRARMASPSRAPSSARAAPRSREAASARSAPRRESSAGADRGGSRRSAVRRKN